MSNEGKTSTEFSVRFGDYILTLLETGSLWFSVESGEGMEIGPAEVERILARYYAEHF